MLARRAFAHRGGQGNAGVRTVDHRIQVLHVAQHIGRANDAGGRDAHRANGAQLDMGHGAKRQVAQRGDFMAHMHFARQLELGHQQRAAHV
jgi:hypothetical protein